MQLHLDPIGGIAGDMFIAALLDAFPEHEAGLLASIDAAGIEPAVACRLTDHNDGVLSGRRFTVAPVGTGTASIDAQEASPHPGAPAHHSHHADGGLDRHRPDAKHEAHDGHTPWRVIRARLEASTLAAPVKRHALGIFQKLAEAEGRVHGIAAEAVTFHEVGAWDSIADIVGAAYLIAELGAHRWTFGPLPLGSGRIRTAHGVMPVPAPATADLLHGVTTIDDGVPGERVTPTGAAIVRYLTDVQTPADAEPRLLQRTGTGFGSHGLPGLSNCLRVLAFAGIEDQSKRTPEHRELAVLEFEVDDQAAEGLAAGLDRLRAQAGIFDVVQAPVFGKKGRMMTQVQVLARPEALAAARAACFRETTTIGLRHRIVQASALARRHEEVEVDGRAIRVKIVERPDGPTAKAEADDVLAAESHNRRDELRAEAERRALALEPAHDPNP